jgi:3-oxoacyl-[acyl-carrier protein] reductase
MKKVALVTGASRGLGAEIARKLGADGWAVVVNCAHDTTSAGYVASSIRDQGSHAIVAQFDVTDKQAVAAGVAEIADRLGAVDLVVNNATGPQPMRPILDQSWEDHLDQLKFFVAAPHYLLQALLPDWRGRKSGRIVNIGSEVVDIGNANFAHYVAAKAAMVGLTRSWATELGPEGITVNLVAPGFIPVERHVGVSTDVLDGYRAHVPLRRLGTPADVAALVAYLASPAGDFITGQTLSVNGGRTFA